MRDVSRTLEQLRKLAERLRDEPELMAGTLGRFRVIEGISEDELANRLNTSPLGIARLALCNRPHSESPDFSDQVRQIAEYAQVEQSAIANLIRHVESVETLAKYPGEHQLKDGSLEGFSRFSGVLAAARDADESYDMPGTEEHPPSEEDKDVSGSDESGRD